MRCLTWWVALAFAALVSAADAAAQASPLDDARSEAVRNLEIGTKLRISTEAGATHYGLFGGWSDAGLLYESDVQPARLLSAEIAELSAERHAWRKGALIGAIPGTLLGVLFGIVANGVCDNGQIEQGCGEHGLRYALIFGALGAGSGGAVGAITGSAFHEWHSVYSSSDTGR